MTTRLVFGCKSEGNRLSTTVRGRGLTQIDIYIIISHHHSRVLARLVWLGVSQTEHAIFTYDSTNQHEIQHLHETFRANVFPVKVINSIHNTLSHNHSKLLGDMTTTMVSQTLSMSMATTYTGIRPRLLLLSSINGRGGYRRHPGVRQYCQQFLWSKPVPILSKLIL